MMHIYFVSLGCDKNLVDSEKMLALLTKEGYELTDEPEQAEIIVVNTCAFIHDAKQESIETLLELAEYKKTGKCKVLIASGCLAERYQDTILEEMPEIVERELKEGHEIGVHTYTHESCEIYASCQAYYEDVNKVRDVLEKRFDYKPQLWRFPWGSANCYIHSYKEEIIQRLGDQNMEYADWNVSAEDSVGSPTVDSILRNVKKDAFRVKDPVVLMHDSGSNQATLDSLEAVITLFEEQGYRFETMSQRENCCHFGQ